MECLIFVTDKPGAPGKPEVPEPGPTSMLVKWRAPVEDGGCAIDGYVLEYRVEGQFKWKPASDDIIPSTSYKVSLIKKSQCHVTVWCVWNKSFGQRPETRTMSILSCKWLRRP